ncbi:hypothetical protein [Celeribacter baekdonensis]|uniref:hypothetical protein n=1 Tax=Celeribacter baekdonensis TaxID=875171 RepID=UPI0030DB4EB9
MTWEQNAIIFLVMFYWFGTFGSLIVQRKVHVTSEEVLRKRLWAYGRLKSTQGQQFPFRNGKFVSNVEFEVLLGILKKVEQKNSVLIAIWGLIYAALGAVFAGAVFSDRPLPLALWIVVALAVAGMPFVVASIVGIRQVDNFDSPFADPEKNKWSEEKQIEAMQAELISDVLRKEEMFFLSRTGCLLFLVLPLLMFILTLHT